MPTEASNWHKAVQAMAVHLARGDYPVGNLAALRRLDPERRDIAPFWMLIAQHAPAAFDNEYAARALAITMNGMAITHPFHFPTSRQSLGTAMAQSGVSEARLLRLLRSRPRELPAEVRRLARLIAAKGDDGRFDWTEVFLLVFNRDRDKVRRDIAKDYYGRQYNLQRAEGENV